MKEAYPYGTVCPVMWEGRSNGTLDVAEANQEKIMARATGLEIAEE